MKVQALILTIVLLISVSINSDLRRNNLNHPKKAEVSFIKKTTNYVGSNFKAASELTIIGFSIGLEEMYINSLNAREKINENSTKFSLGVKNTFLSFGKYVAVKFDQITGKEKQRLAAAAAQAELLKNQQVEEEIKTPDIKCDATQFLKEFSGSVAVMSYLEYGKNIVEYNSEKRWPIASISKLMTAVIASEKTNLDSRIRMSTSSIATYGTSGEFTSGEIFTGKDLVKAALIVSSNDAAMAIAENFGKDEFVNEMQKKAKELGMLQTTYLEPTGLSFVNQSTASDLTKLANYVYKNHPELLEISRSKVSYIKELKTATSRKIFNVDSFAGDKEFLGGKTGFIDEAGRNLLAIFDYEGHPVLTIVMGTTDSFAETKKLVGLLKSCEVK